MCGLLLLIKKSSAYEHFVISMNASSSKQPIVAARLHTFADPPRELESNIKEAHSIGGV